MPTLRRDMSVGLLGNVVRRNDFDEDFLEFVLGVFIAELGERAFDQEFSRLDDADGVAELFDFAHDVGGKDDGLSIVTASRMKAVIVRADMMSRPLVGSSKIITGGSW